MTRQVTATRSKRSTTHDVKTTALSLAIHTRVVRIVITSSPSVYVWSPFDLAFPCGSLQGSAQGYGILQFAFKDLFWGQFREKLTDSTLLKPFSPEGAEEPDGESHHGSASGLQSRIATFLRADAGFVAYFSRVFLFA